MATKTYLEAVRDAHHEVLRDFDDAFVMGEDVRKSLTGTTIGLVEAFGEERVRNTPISEWGFTGLGIGAAMDGKRPIVEYEINTLVHVGFEQLVNHAAKIRYMSGGTVSIPLTITVPMGGIMSGAGGQHADMTHAGLMHYGIKTVIPTTPYDAKGLFRSAVEEDDPVIVFFPAALHGNQGEVPDESYAIPLGRAQIKRKGEDVTVIAIGETVPTALEVADEFDGKVSVEVIDPRTLLPLDEATIFDSIQKTGRAIIVDDANRMCGAAAEIAARISNNAFWHLDAPVKRVTRPNTPVSYAPPEERQMTPKKGLVAQAVADLT